MAFWGFWSCKKNQKTFTTNKIGSPDKILDTQLNFHFRQTTIFVSIGSTWDIYVLKYFLSKI